MQANYAGVAGDFRLVNAALHPTQKEAMLEYVADIRGLPIWSCAIGSMVPSVKHKHIRMICEECGRTPTFVEITVPCVTFEELLHDYEVEAVHELHIDTEGMDKEILVSFPFDRFRPAKVVFEFLRISSCPTGRRRFLYYMDLAIACERMTSITLRSWVNSRRAMSPVAEGRWSLYVARKGPVSARTRPFWTTAQPYVDHVGQLVAGQFTEALVHKRALLDR